MRADLFKYTLVSDRNDFFGFGRTETETEIRPPKPGRTETEIKHFEFDNKDTLEYLISVLARSMFFGPFLL